MIFISATITYGNFEDGLGASYVSGESIGGFAEIEEGTKDAQDFYERINEINDNLKLIEKKNGLTFGTDAYLLSAFLPKKQNNIGSSTRFL